MAGLESREHRLYGCTVRQGWHLIPVIDLVPKAAEAHRQVRAILPARELGAYEALWDQDVASFRKLAGMFQANPGSVPSDFVSEADAEHYLGLARAAILAAGIKEFGTRVHGAGEIPQRLRDAEHPVELLYFQGNWEVAHTRCVAVIGTRRPGEEGRRRAVKLSRGFVNAGFTVVSGMAQGIDTVAHTTAIEAGGRTIAVLGTPITTCYPQENRALQQRIAEDHLVISQVPVIRYSRQSFHENRLYFPARNVTMSALAEATVIVEAGETSGALIQARHAIQQRRKLFILDNCFRQAGLTWPTKFLERGAIRITEFGEILRHLGE
jgi:DNA processing protein